MCAGCIRIYGPEYVIRDELRKRFGSGEAAQLPATQEEWNALYPQLQTAIQEHIVKGEAEWDKMLKEENDANKALG